MDRGAVGIAALDDRDQARLDKRIGAYARLREAREDDRPDLAGFGMARVASIECVGGRVIIQTAEGWQDASPGVYAFVADRWVVRVGSSAKGVPVRLKQFARHVTVALTKMRGESIDLKAQTPDWEALLWEHIYGATAGEVWARASVAIESDLGPVEPRAACKVEEKIVADHFAAPGMKMPVLNRSTRIN